MVAAPLRARGWLRRLARAPLPAGSALSFALALARPPLHGGRSCSARPPAHTHSHTDTRSHPRAPPLSGGAAHLIPYAGGVSHRRGLGGGERGRREKRGGQSWPGGPLALKLRACTGGIERVLQGIGVSPPCSRHSSARPRLSGAGGAGTWAGAIPRPKNNGRELGRGRGEAGPAAAAWLGVWGDP